MYENLTSLTNMTVVWVGQRNCSTVLVPTSWHSVADRQSLFGLRVEMLSNPLSVLHNRVIVDHFCKGCFTFAKVALRCSI